MRKPMTALGCLLVCLSLDGSLSYRYPHPFAGLDVSLLLLLRLSLSVCLSVCLSVYLSVCLYVCLSLFVVCISMYVCLFASPPPLSLHLVIS